MKYKFDNIPFLSGLFLSFLLMGSLTLLLDPSLSRIDCEAAYSALQKQKKVDENLEINLQKADDLTRGILSRCEKQELQKYLSVDDSITNNWSIWLPVGFLVWWLIFGISIGWIRNWLGVDTTVDLPSIAVNFLKRARICDRRASLTLIFIVFVIVGAAVIFYKAASFAEDDIVALMSLFYKFSFIEKIQSPQSTEAVSFFRTFRLYLNSLSGLVT